MSNTKEFNPVKIEIEFCTREQLAAFIAVMYNYYSVAVTVDKFGALSKKGNSMNAVQLSSALNSLIEPEELEELVKLVDS